LCIVEVAEVLDCDELRPAFLEKERELGAGVGWKADWGGLV
jgi:hypothetical protein